MAMTLGLHGLRNGHAFGCAAVRVWKHHRVGCCIRLGSKDLWRGRRDVLANWLPLYTGSPPTPVSTSRPLPPCQLIPLHSLFPRPSVCFLHPSLPPFPFLPSAHLSPPPFPASCHPGLMLLIRRLRRLRRRVPRVVFVFVRYGC